MQTFHGVFRRSTSRVSTHWSLADTRQLIWMCSVILNFPETAVKIAILLLYKRIFTTKIFAICVWIGIAAISVWGIVFFAVGLQAPEETSGRYLLTCPAHHMLTGLWYSSRSQMHAPSPSHGLGMQPSPMTQRRWAWHRSEQTSDWTLSSCASQFLSSRACICLPSARLQWP